MLLKDLIADYVAKHGISYRAFAKQCGVSSAYLSMINSRNNPSTGKPPVVSIQKLAKIAAGMGMSVHSLIQLVDDMPVDISGDSNKSEASDVLIVNKPSGEMETEEIRKFLHDVIDQLGDDDLRLMKDLSIRITRKI